MAVLSTSTPAFALYRRLHISFAKLDKLIQPAAAPLPSLTSALAARRGIFGGYNG